MKGHVPSALAALLSCALFTPVAGFAQTPPIADARFKALDVNEDGGLSTYEYNGETAIQMMDDDKNGKVSGDELQRYFGPEKDKVASAAERVVGADLDGDGELSADELQAGLEQRFKWMDKNQDGNVDLDEYRAAFGVAQFDRKGRVAH